MSLTDTPTERLVCPAFHVPGARDLGAGRSGQQDLPAGLVVGEEIARREAHLARLAEAKAILEARAASGRAIRGA
ncbi:MAG TPA: hypothetical protein VNL35_11425 [Chloroflexota bacterium]|nr:hypothetical protein [Chloroflexota bacterium]